MTATSRPWRIRYFATTNSLSIENAEGWEVCRFYSVVPIDEANADLIVQMANSWDSADALRTRIHALTQPMLSVVDSIDAPQEPLT